MKKTILQNWTGEWPEIRCTKPLPTGEGVIDDATFRTIEVDELFENVNHAETMVGQSILYRSLSRPADNLEQVKEKQEAVKEIQNNPELQSNLQGLVSHAADGEKNFYLLLYGQFLGAMGTAREENEIEGFGYVQYIRGTRFLQEFVAHAKALQTPESTYLKQVLQKIHGFSSSRSFELAVGPAYISEQGIQSKTERKGKFNPAVIFRPTLFKPLFMLSVFAIIWFFLNIFPSDMFSFSKESIPVASIFFIPLLLVYIPVVGGFDRDHAIIPLRDIFRQSEDVAEALDALGQLDELLAFTKYAEAFGSEMVLPELMTAPHHKLELQNAKNPILGKANPDYVGNDLSLDKDRLIFITGPNSGGKTAFCKTVTQIQLLTQIGCFVPADRAVLTVADRIFYQAPEISHLDDGEGRFGTELKRTKNIFLSCTAQSLVVLDELSEGTTFEEKMATSITVLEGFVKKGCSTLLITHNHQLVDHFINQKTGQARQVEFKGDAPTYRLIKGISRVSHAERIAKKIGFAKADIEKYLKRQ